LLFFLKQLPSLRNNSSLARHLRGCLQVILARLKLSSEDDEFGKWVLQQQNVQMLNANTNWELILQG
jgi:hypothetical protein